MSRFKWLFKRKFRFTLGACTRQVEKRDSSEEKSMNDMEKAGTVDPATEQFSVHI